MAGRRTPWRVFACAVPFLAYFALLVHCDVWRPEQEGLRLDFGTRLLVKDVEPGSAAARAGLVAGDEILAVGGRPVGSRKLDWEAATINATFSEPIVLEVRRGAAEVRVLLVLEREPWSRWATREGVDLAIVRLVQAATLGVGLLVLYRRPDDPVARLGAWLLGAVGVFCVTLPSRIAVVWRALWWPAGATLWIPYVSSVLAGPLLLTFFLLFPVRRVRGSAALAAVWLPALGLVPFVRYRAVTVYRPWESFATWDGFTLMLGLSMAYLAAAVAAAAWSYRRLEDATERRRLRVLLAGGGVGCAGGGAVIVGWWLSGSLSLFGAPAMGWLVPLLVAVPVSFGYAILRHRLFDVRLILRRGVQYALARRLLLSLAPALLLGMAVDLYVHRDEPMRDVVAARALAYLVASAAAILAQSRRQRWLDALDRRFFRERYDAQRILRQVADDIKDSGGIERASAQVVAQIEVALHPRFVALLHRPAGADAFRPIAAAPPGSGPERMAPAAKIVALARLVGGPLETSERDTTSLSVHLPEEEVAAVRGLGLALLVPIGGDDRGPEALLALGERRSEEPYAREDRDLLQAIATTLGLLLSRGADTAAGATFRECPRCGTCYEETASACGTDGEVLAAVRLPRLLVARYRLDARLGRGGMGTVYAASDLALEREVAVKVLRDDLAGDAEAVGRFEREARTAAGLSHPNVVTIHDFGVTAGGRAFLVMERLQGRTLREEMERHGALPPARTVSVLRGVCAAVDAAHRRRLVHRDLKPENVFLATIDEIEVPKVLDFGIAKAFRAATGVRGSQTAAGVLVGTPEYMAPEQLRGEDAGPSWDLWALGVLTYELLTGGHPFSSIVVGRVDGGLTAAPTSAARTPHALADDRWSAFFEEALAIDPIARPPNAAAFCARLERILLP
jgi:hypothetical protein